jgi:hypothetical protein
MKIFGFGNTDAEKLKRKGLQAYEFLKDPKYRFDAATFRISTNTDVT